MPTPAILRAYLDTLRRPLHRLSSPADWRSFWQTQSQRNVSDFELDRGRSPRDTDTEALADEELVEFIGPQPHDRILDAGCGTGVNILRLQSQVHSVLGLDYTWGAIARCRARACAHELSNARLLMADVTAIPLSASSVDKILCLSVLQYLDDHQARHALREFARVLATGGVLILHVKNFSSLYWSTLWLVKALKRLLGRHTRLEHLRSFRWYVNELRAVNCEIVTFNSFNLFGVDRMPTRLLSLLQRAELRYRNSRVLQRPFIRRRGAELKIKARVIAESTAPGSPSHASRSEAKFRAERRTRQPLLPPRTS